MSPESSFILITIVVIGGLFCGYMLRRAGLIHDRARKIVSLLVMLTTYPVVNLLAIWRMDLQKQFVILPIILVVCMSFLLAFGWIYSYIHRLSRPDRGVFISACAISNASFSMGGMVCYLMYGHQGLGLSQIYLILWSLFIVLAIFPVTHYFSPHSAQQSLGHVIFRGIWHIRSVIMLGTAVGITLSLFKVPYPRLINRFRLLQLFMFGGTFVTFTVIGLSLRVSKIRDYIRLYISLAGFKFIISPLLALLVVVLFRLDLSSLSAKVVLTVGFMPAGVYTVFLANLFDLNDKLASAIFVVNTIVFLVVVLPILLIFGV